MLEPLKNESSSVNIIIRKFYKSSLDYDLGPDEILQMTWSRQEEFLNATVKSQHMQKFPAKNQFIKLFLKKLILHLETKQEVHDDLYKYLCLAMNCNDAEDYCYRHYVIGNNMRNIVTLRETNKMVVNGTTGMRTWEAAIMLADWALFNIEKFKTKKVFELGSGVGFTGITVAKFCKPKEFIFSDFHEDVLGVIDNNIAMNFPKWQRENSSASIIYRDTDQSLGVMKFDWFNFSDVASKIDPDVIIGADIIYDPTILHALCQVILHFFNLNKNLEVYIAGAIRNEETLNMFLQQIGSLNLQHQLINLADNIYIEWDTTVPKYLLEIRNKN